jgi:hypothetical protein
MDTVCENRGGNILFWKKIKLIETVLFEAKKILLGHCG